jgi:hypothetical protein
MTAAISAVQANFASALLDADQPVPGAVTSHTARAPQKRFAVYRNNVVAGLVEALRTQFPATERIVGEDFFAAMARIYVAAEPPRSPILVAFGDGFPGFIANFAPAAELPYLADVARLEVARTRAYHAADAAPLDPSCWERLDPSALLDVRVALHPSVQILRSSYPIVTIWSMNSGEDELASIEDCNAEDALVLRPQLDVQVRSLPLGGAAFLGALAWGAALGDAAISAATDNPEFELAANLAGLIGAGLVTELLCPPMQKEPTP